ncbi:hypothetical protein AAMO2058_000847600 [Amorphochlora amoebiformis]
MGAGRCSWLAEPFAFLTQRIRKICSEWSVSEVSGSVGDLGTLLPFLVALAKEDNISIGPALFFAGLFNITSAIHWDIPMPVQPMKAIATVALTSEGLLNANSILCAGILTASFVACLGLSRGIDFLHRIIPMPVVFGIQVGLGIRMITKAFKLARKSGIWLGLDSKITAFFALVITLGLRHNRRVPTALLVFMIGLIFAAAVLISHGGGDGGFPRDNSAPFYWTVSELSAEDWRDGFLHGAIPQIPLTTLNSVIAVTKLAHDLYPQKRDQVTRAGVASAVGVMNVLGCALGAMPMCHGAGGLAAQHSFGARGGLSVMILGTCKVLISVIFGGTAILSLLSEFPDSILGALLGISGLELAVSGLKGLGESYDAKSNTNRHRYASLVCLATAGTAVATGNTALGCVAGFILAIAESEWVKSKVGGTEVEKPPISNVIERKRGVKDSSEIGLEVGEEKGSACEVGSVVEVNGTLQMVNINLNGEDQVR